MHNSVALLIFTILCNRCVFPKHFHHSKQKHRTHQVITPHPPFPLPLISFNVLCLVNLLLIVHVSEIMQCLFLLSFFFNYLVTLAVSGLSCGTGICHWAAWVFHCSGGVSCSSTGGILVSNKGLNLCSLFCKVYS